MNACDASVKAFDAIVRFFEEDDWKFSRQEGKLILHMACGNENGHYMCVVHVRTEHPVVVFYSMAGFRVPGDKRPAMAEFITRANYGLCVGNFEMDFSDGEIRYKASIDVRDGKLTGEMVRALVYVNISTMDRYFPGMMSVLWKDVSPEAAVAHVEGRDGAPSWPWERAGVRGRG